MNMYICVRAHVCVYRYVLMSEFEGVFALSACCIYLSVSLICLFLSLSLYIYIYIYTTYLCLCLSLSLRALVTAERAFGVFGNLCSADCVFGSLAERVFG